MWQRLAPKWLSGATSSRSQSGGSRRKSRERAGAGSGSLPFTPVQTFGDAGAAQMQGDRSAQALAAQEAEQLQLALALSLSQEAEQREDANASGHAAAARQRASAPQQAANAAVPLPGTIQRSVSDFDGDVDPTSGAESQAFERMSEIIANCEETRENFVDPGFVPGPRVLYFNGQCRRRQANDLAVVRHFGTGSDDIHWLHAGEILQRPDDLQMQFESTQEMLATAQQFARVVEWRVFQSDPNPSDISQGGLGNCWFCGSLAAVAEKPQLIRRLFVDPFSRKGELSPKGVYVLQICDGGEWHFEVLDGLLPCNRYRMLAFSGARRNQLWVPLLEKAYAKLRGCYEAIEGGTPAEGLRLFTGWPSIVQELRTNPNRREPDQVDALNALKTQAVCPYAGEDLLWTRLVSAFESRLIICGSCGHVEGISDEQYRTAGLSPSHCYSIVKVVSAAQGSLRLLKLRNPWGTGRKWNGKFSDTDIESWTPELKSEVGADDLGEEGIFWMTLQDIRRYFASLTICPYRDGWAEARRKLVFPASVVRGPQPAMLLTSASQVEALLSCMQPEERSAPSMMTADVGFAIFRLPRRAVPQMGEEVQRINSKGGACGGTDLKISASAERRVQDTLVCDYFINSDVSGGEPQPVLVVPLCFNQRGTANGVAPGNDKTVMFACFSPCPIVVRSINISAEAHRDALIAHTKHSGSKSRIFDGAYLYKSTESGLVVYLENTSMETVLFTTQLTDLFNMTVSRGMEATEWGDQFLFARDTVPPMHGMVIFVAAAMPAGHRYQFAPKVEIDRSGRDIHEPPLATPSDALHTPFLLEGHSPPAMQQWAPASAVRGNPQPRGARIWPGTWR